MQDSSIDHGEDFDWGRTSAEYARYRDIYPDAFFRRITDAGLCTAGQRVLDLGTGTGVLPRGLYAHGARFTGVDCSRNQINQAIALSRAAGMTIDYVCTPAEQIDFPDGSFDTVTACQCLIYFNHAVLAPKLSPILAAGGRLVFLYMAWLPGEDPIAGQSEALISAYNPSWTGRGETRRFIEVPAAYLDYFTLEHEEVFDLPVPFTRESWNGRVRTCRGIGAALSGDEIARFDSEHRALLNRIAPDRFNVLHYGALTVLKKKSLTALSFHDGDKCPCSG